MHKMSRPRRQAAVKCVEKLHEVLKPRKNIKHVPESKPSAEENVTKTCSVRLTKMDVIPQSMLNEHHIKPCSVKLIKASKTVVNSNCVYMPVSTKSQIKSKGRPRQATTTSVKTSIAKDTIYDFVPCSQRSSNSGSEDESMKNIIQKLQKKNNVRVVKGRKKERPPKKDLHKSWTEKNIRKAKQLIKCPKTNKLDKVQIIDVIKNDIVIPIKRPPVVRQNNVNESILPLIEDLNEDNDHFCDHFGNDDNDYKNDENQNNSSLLFNSNIENINPIMSPSKTKVARINPILRSPLKQLNSQIFNRSGPSSPRKDTPTLRNNLLKSLYNASITSSRTENPMRRHVNAEDQNKIEDANVTNYFGFTTDLSSEVASAKKSSANSNTSTPVRLSTKEILIAKLQTLKSSVPKSALIKYSQQPSARLRRKAAKPTPTNEFPENTTINFADALSSTLLVQPTTKKNSRRTYSRHENKNRINNQKKAMAIDLFDNPETRPIPLDDTFQRRSPVKKGPAKVYEKKIQKGKKDEEDPELLSFYESFNNECQEINKFKLITE